MGHGTLDRPPSLADAVVAHIRDAIVRGAYAPGRSLTETGLAEELGTSRGTVREALRELGGLGLVTRSPHRGAVVPTLTARDAEETFTLRAALESYAAQLALARGKLDDAALRVLAERVDAIAAAAEAGDLPGMVNADVEFHASLSSLSGHTLLMEHLTAIQHRSQWLLFYSDAYRPRPDVVVRGGDASRVAQAIDDHITGPGADIVASMVEQESRGQEMLDAIDNSKGGAHR